MRPDLQHASGGTIHVTATLPHVGTLLGLLVADDPTRFAVFLREAERVDQAEGVSLLLRQRLRGSKARNMPTASRIVHTFSWTVCCTDASNTEEKTGMRIAEEIAGYEMPSYVTLAAWGDAGVPDSSQTRGRWYQ